MVFRSFLPPIFLIMCVLGSIFAGVATPTEAAAVGALGSIILALFNRRLTKTSNKKCDRKISFKLCNDIWTIYR